MYPAPPVTRIVSDIEFTPPRAAWRCAGFRRSPRILLGSNTQHRDLRCDHRQPMNVSCGSPRSHFKELINARGDRMMDTNTTHPPGGDAGRARTDRHEEF